MRVIKIDNKDYELNSLSDEAKVQLASQQLVHAKSQRPHAKSSVLPTARMTYAKALNKAFSVCQTLN